MAVNASLMLDNKQLDASPKQDSAHAVTVTLQLWHTC